MKLADFIDVLGAAGLDVHAEDVLDMLWLASRRRGLSLHAPAGVPARVESPADAAQASRGGGTTRKPAGTKPAPGSGSAPQARGERDSRIYAQGSAGTGDRTVRAAPVAIPAGRALANRLALMRSLRPLCMRWSSTRDLEIDEEQTAEASASMGSFSSRPIHPIFRPSLTRWYDADVVLEDDPAIEVWSEAIRDFRQVLRDTGAFRVVRSWRLRVDHPEDIESDAGSSIVIETPTGARLSPNALGGTGTRRLIFFATHGSSPLWRDGTYASVLAPWARDASVVLLHVLPRDRWAYTALGDAHGLCLAEKPGLPAALLGVEPFWWQLGDGDVAAMLKVPATPLDAAAMGDWAAMQMGRGARAPMFLLDPARRDAVSAASGLTSKHDFERAIAQLRETSPEAFLLGVYLSPSYFTIPVARLIQEVKFGAAAHPSQLGELFLSGLVFARAGTDNNGSTEERYFGFWPQAREILMQSLRDQDARSIAQELEERVSRHIEEVSGLGVTFRALVPRQDGTYELPDWAQPFARVANSVLGLPDASEHPAELVSAFAKTASPIMVAAAAAAAARDRALSAKMIGAELFDALKAARLLWRTGKGRWRFLPGMKEQLALQSTAAEQDVAMAPTVAVPDAPPLAKAPGIGETGRVTITMYRQGFGDCFLVILEGKKGGNFNILVNCGVILGTPNAVRVMTNVAEDVRHRTGARIDLLVVTQAHWNKVSGFVQASSVFERSYVDEVVMGWWEDPSDALAVRMRKDLSLGQASRSQKAVERAKALGRSLRFSRPSDPPIDLADTGARLYCLGAPHDGALVRKTYPGPVPGLDCAIELAGGDVLLYANSSSALAWSMWQHLSWSVGDGIMSARDLLSRVVFCRVALIGQLGEEFEQKALPLMPRLRVVAVPIDHAILERNRWRAPALNGIEQVLRQRDGAILVSDAEGLPTVPLSARSARLWFQLEFGGGSR